MSVFPEDLDDDSTLPRLDDNLSEMGVEAINAIRSAVFNIETALGISPSGSKDSVADRLDTSLNADGSIKASALTSVGLVTLPIDNSHIGTNAGILESKLSLDYSTSDLNTLIQSNSTLLSSLSGFFATLETTVNSHIAGSTNSTLRHVASHIDLNSVPSDSRDVNFTWDGLYDKDGNARSATNVAGALFQINESLINHENSELNAHVASAITVDTSNFQELSRESETLQEVLENIDNIEELQLGTHRATMHSSGVPKDARSISFLNSDGYGHTVIPSTAIVAHVAHNPPGTGPIDSVSVGDNIITFQSDNTDFAFDAMFKQVQVGDVIRINYGNGIEDIRYIDSIRFSPGSEWAVRVNGVNLRDTDGYTATAIINRPLFDSNIYGVSVVAAANATPLASYSNVLGSVIVGHPQGAVALGIGFNSNQIDSTHYNLYLELYPNGKPEDKVIQLPAIDISGNAGITPGKYTLSDVIQATNNKFREIGYNYRFIAFEYNGNFGIMLADAIDGASFSIVSGSNSGGFLSEGTYTNNVIGNARSENWDALGLGVGKANLAGPAYQGTWSDSTDAQLSTKVIHPAKRRNYIVNGKVFDSFKNKPGTTEDENGFGYWPAEISARTVTSSTVETTYRVDKLLTTSGLKVGKTIVVQPAVELTDPLYSNNDYGRFIIKEITFSPCGNEETSITVINGIHGLGSGVGFSSSDLPVRLYFGEDSVGFDSEHMIDGSSTGQNYHRNFEIYITESRTTFSHERARLPVQSETTDLLSTEFWHINDVSSKLKGYLDSGSSNFNKYVRLYILSYDSDTGEYDGYIGKRIVGGTIEKTGPVITGRKNVVSRFYDETYVDYIDLEFVETSTTLPGLSILSTDRPRYVDIELFPSLSNNDELLLLSTCEVNWEPTVGKNIIERVIDKREIGSISEQEFTQSAIDFIRAGEKYLHDNGVIRGFNYVGQGTDTHEFFFNGGVALVNGHIIAVNNSSVIIPEIISEGGSLPETLTWAVCVNDVGNLVPVLLTTTKEAFFTEEASGGTGYYIQSVSFDELVYNRKDLTLINIIEVVIASFTIVSINDARRFIINETSNIPLTLIGNDAAGGNFNTFDQLKTWMRFVAPASSFKVVLKGTFDIDEQIDLSSLADYDTTILFEGDNAIFNVSSPIGFKIVNNIHFKNITFNYNPTGLTLSSTTLNADLNNACILTTQLNFSNIKIDNCVFASNSTHPPFIQFTLTGTGTASEIDVSNNKFDDEMTGDSAGQGCVIFTTQTGLGSFRNISIKNNKCLGWGTIALLPNATFGAFASNFVIDSNTAGCIGFFTETTSTDRSYNNGLLISNNTAVYIGKMLANGSALATETLTGLGATGAININNNFVSSICVPFASDSIIRNPSLIIANNTLFAEDPDTAHDILGRIDASNVGIMITRAKTGSSTSGLTSIISNNTLRRNYDTTIYDDGIWVRIGDSIIENNVIEDFDGYGIRLDNEYGSISSTHHTVHGNHLYRFDTDISAYVGGSTGTTTALIRDNFFDNTTTDGSDEELITPPGSVYWRSAENKNQTIIQYIHPGAGSFGNLGEEDTEYTFSLLNSFIFTNNASATAKGFVWQCPLSVVPYGAKIIQVGAKVACNVQAATTGSASITLRNRNSGFTNLVNADNTANFTSSGSYTATTFLDITCTPTANSEPIVNTDGLNMNIGGTINHSIAATITCNEIFVKYRW